VGNAAAATQGAAAAAPAASYGAADAGPAESAASSPTIAAPSAGPVQAAFRKASSRPAFGHPLLSRLLGDPFTPAFALGSIIVIFFLFMPILDTQKVDRRRAVISSGDLTQQRLDKEAKQRDGARPTAAQRDETKKRHDAWDTEKSGLEQDAEQARIDADNNHYWYTWGTLIGFLVLAVAAIGYMSPGQTTVRKVTGSIIICAILLLVFFRILTK
jgi:hypothetical protein